MSLFGMLTMTLYVRFTIEVYMVMILSSFFEIFENDTSTDNRQYSLAFAYLIMNLCLAFLIFCFYVWTKTRHMLAAKFKSSTDVK
jgi:hypothetical protein